jgi:hypothetical protein
VTLLGYEPGTIGHSMTPHYTPYGKTGPCSRSWTSSASTARTARP